MRKHRLRASKARAMGAYLKEPIGYVTITVMRRETDAPYSYFTDLKE